LKGWQWQIDNPQPAAAPAAGTGTPSAPETNETPEIGDRSVRADAPEDPGAAPSDPQPKPPPRPAPGRCARCGGQTGRLKRLRDRATGTYETSAVFCPACDGIHTGTPQRVMCNACGTWGLRVTVRPRNDDGQLDQRRPWHAIVHELTGSVRCPTEAQADQHDGLREADKPGPDLRLRDWLDPARRHEKTGTAEPVQQRDPNGWPVNTGDPEPAQHPRETTGNEGDTMPEQSGEVTGIPSAITYERAMAGVHRRHADNETLVTSMANMEVGEGDLGLVRNAMADSAAAAAAFDLAADELEKTNAGVREGYASAPDAADKQHQVA
jgi:hypothetical protein